MEDNQILSLLLAREDQGLKELEQKYGTRLKYLAMGMLPEEDAEECVNDTYLKAWNTIPPKQPSVLRTYLGKLTRNLSIDRLRTLHRKKRDVDLLVAAEELDRCLGTASDVEDGELCSALDGFLAGLDDVERRLFVGRYWYTYEVNRLAGAYGMTPNAVTKQLGRTREKLRAYLAERGYTV